MEQFNESVYTINFNGNVIGNKCALFSFKDCLIKLRTPEEMLLSSSPWYVSSCNVRFKLEELVSSGYTILVFSDYEEFSLSEFEQTAKEFSQLIYLIPMSFYYCSKNDIFSKPRCQLLKELSISKDSFYVGKSTQIAGAYNKDILFSMNYEIPNYLASNYFKHDLTKHSYYWFEPKEIILQEDPDYTSNNQEIIIMVGPPGSRKSYIAKKTGYEIVHPGNAAKCKSECIKYIKEGKSVVIDDCHPKHADRDRYIKIANKYNIPFKVVYIEMSQAMAKHLCKYRFLTEGIEFNEKKLEAYYRKFEYPIYIGLQNTDNYIKRKSTISEEDELIRMYL